MAGSIPCDFSHTGWDYEQFCDHPWAEVANYSSLYVLTALEPDRHQVAEAPWSAAEWAVFLRLDNLRATVLVLVLR